MTSKLLIRILVLGLVVLVTSSPSLADPPFGKFELSVAVDGVIDDSFDAGDPQATGDPSIFDWFGTHESPSGWSFGNGPALRIASPPGGSMRTTSPPLCASSLPA